MCQPLTPKNKPHHQGVHYTPLQTQQKQKETGNINNKRCNNNTHTKSTHNIKQRGVVGRRDLIENISAPTAEALELRTAADLGNELFGTGQSFTEKKISAFGGVGWRPITIRQVLPATACCCSGAPPRVGQRMQRALSYGYSFPPGART